jgi:hypothetical protein
MIEWERRDRVAKNIEMKLQPGEPQRIDISHNSDMQEDYFLDNTKVDWKKEYMKIRFTTLH